MTDAPNFMPARHSLFSPDTLKGLRAARDEAALAVNTGGAQALAALRVCEQVVSAVAASDAGMTDEARRILHDALAETADLRLLFLGYQFHFRLSEYDEAERLVQRRLDLAAADSPDAARAWNNLGLIDFFRGNLDRAESMMRRALDIDTRAAFEEGIARDLGNLALIPEKRGDLDSAERLYRESLIIAERIGASSIVASKLSNLGEIALARGRHDEARTLWTQAAAIFSALGCEQYRSQCANWISDLDASKHK